MVNFACMNSSPEGIFEITTHERFTALALEVFRQQYEKNAVYKEYCDHLGVDATAVNAIHAIPFLPIQFFKSKTVITGDAKVESVFTSSGTTGSVPSKHYVTDLALYEQSFLHAFERFYGNIESFCVLALLPSYLERSGSSLIYMANRLIEKSKHEASGFYLDNLEALKKQLAQLEAQGTKTLLLGVSFALLDLAESFGQDLKHTIVMETGGMKGRRKEMVRDELHQVLKQGLGVSHIHSEYGMTELLSQAYSKGNGLFHCPPWMKVLTRDTQDPLSLQTPGKSGGLNIVDLANSNSCAFIATQDLGRVYPDGSFEVQGRFDHAEIRGCNLMVF